MKNENTYKVIDFYENPLGDVLCTTHSLAAARVFAEQFTDDTDGECSLAIVKNP